MDEFTYSISAKIDPPKASPGERITITVNISNIKGQLKTVYAMVNSYGFSQMLPKTSEGMYSARIAVPYGAPVGTYNVLFFAKNNEGYRGNEVTFRFQVV